MTGRCFVLTFHRVVDDRERDHDLSWASFRRLLEQLVGAPVTTDFRVEPDCSKTVLTFDDGTFEHLSVGEALAAGGIPAIFFVSAGKIGSPGYLDEAGLVALRSLGHVIGSHGVHHVLLDRLDSETLRGEVAGSRDHLQSVIGRDILYFAPPGGSSHPDLRAELERSGYSASRSMRWGVHCRNADRFDIPCLPVTELTIARGWISETLSRGQLPWTMRSAYAAKELLPPRARAVVRRRTTQRAVQ